MSFRISPVTFIPGILLIAAGIFSIVSGIWKFADGFDKSVAAGTEWFEKARTAPGESDPPPPHSSGGIPAPVLMFGGFFAIGAGGFLIVAGLAGAGFRMFRRFSPGNTGRVKEEIEQLAKLRADGYISGEDYERASKRVMDEI